MEPSNYNTTLNESSIAKSLDIQILSDSMVAWIELVFIALVYVFALFGIFSNTVNILVFWRLGFSSVSNINLTALSVVDLTTLVVMSTGALGRSMKQVASLSGQALRLIVTPAMYGCMAYSSCITAVISMERCCSVLLPLKVKFIFTRKTVTRLFGAVGVYQLATLVPHYLQMHMITVTMSPNNETVYVFDGSRYDRHLGMLSLLMSFSVPTFVCFFVIIIGTFLLTHKLRQSAEFRRSAAVNQPTERFSTREKTLIKSVIEICVIYIVCWSPNVVSFLVSAVFPPFTVTNPVYGNVFRAVMSLSVLLQAVSASINLVVYLRMMTQYRNIFKKLLLCKDSRL